MRNRIRSNYIPAIVMLSAGAVDVICSIVQHLALLEFLKRLLLVMVIFLFIGWVIKLVLDKCIAVMADKPVEEESKEKDGSETKTNAQEKTDGTAGAKK